MTAISLATLISCAHDADETRTMRAGTLHDVQETSGFVVVTYTDDFQAYLPCKLAIGECGRTYRRLTHAKQRHQEVFAFGTPVGPRALAVETLSIYDAAPGIMPMPTRDTGEPDSSNPGATAVTGTLSDTP